MKKRKPQIRLSQLTTCSIFSTDDHFCLKGFSTYSLALIFISCTKCSTGAALRVVNLFFQDASFLMATSHSVTRNWYINSFSHKPYLLIKKMNEIHAIYFFICQSCLRTNVGCFFFYSYNAFLKLLSL